MMTGKFITFEGGDGVGKSTQIQEIERRLKSAGLPVVRVREPGSTPSAERIRSLILQGQPEDWLPMSELLLMNAARHDLVERVIRPALEAGTWVLADRFADSSRAYQIAAGGLSPEVCEPVIQAATGGLEPDVTVLLQIPMEQAFERIEAQGGDERRFESKGSTFQRRALSAFYALAEQFPERVVPVSALGSVDDVTHRIWTLFEERGLLSDEARAE